jgi:hypothetical protein
MLKKLTNKGVLVMMLLIGSATAAEQPPEGSRGQEPSDAPPLRLVSFPDFQLRICGGIRGYRLLWQPRPPGGPKPTVRGKRCDLRA